MQTDRWTLCFPCFIHSTHNIPVHTPQSVMSVREMREHLRPRTSARKQSSDSLS